LFSNRFLSRKATWRSIAGLSVVAIAVPVALIAYYANATQSGVNGKITYNVNGDTFIANPDGSGAKKLNVNAANPTWAPDGSRLAYRDGAGTGIWSANDDGSGAVQLTNNSADDFPAWDAPGGAVLFSRDGHLMFTFSDGGRAAGDLGENPPAGDLDVRPAVSPSGDLIFERIHAGTPSIYQYKPGTPASPTLLVANATAVDFSPDGQKIAYEAAVGAAADHQIWVADANGSNAAKLTSETDAAHGPKWSPDGLKVLYHTGEGTSPVKSVTVGDKSVAPVTGNGTQLSWQPVRKNKVDRVWGNDATDTAIAASQWNYADNGASDPVRGPAKAVVLSRSDTYFDALAGSALAVVKQAPLLITDKSALEQRVQAEIKRVLGTSGTVYLLGGPLALSAGIESQLTTLGYTTKRLAGATHFDTAIAIDKEITPDPVAAIVTTGINFFDALAAGAAAGANPGTVVVLTNGESMPAASAQYLNSLNPNPDTGTMLVGGGGPGSRALVAAYSAGQMPSWPKDQIVYWPLIGNNEKDTALLLARFFFAAPGAVAIATNKTWQDALTGGAMIGAVYGPLLITDPTGLYGPVGDYLGNSSGSIWDGVILGGSLAIPDSFIDVIGNTIALPGQFTYESFQAINPAGGGRAIKAPAKVAGQTLPRSIGGSKAAKTPPGFTSAQPKIAAKPKR